MEIYSTYALELTCHESVLTEQLSGASGLHMPFFEAGIKLFNLCHLLNAPFQMMFLHLEPAVIYAGEAITNQDLLNGR